MQIDSDSRLDSMKGEKGPTCWALGLCTAEIVDAIVRNTKVVLPISTYIHVSIYFSNRGIAFAYVRVCPIVENIDAAKNKPTDKINKKSIGKSIKGSPGVSSYTFASWREIGWAFATGACNYLMPSCPLTQLFSLSTLSRVFYIYTYMYACDTYGCIQCRAALTGLTRTSTCRYHAFSE